MQWITEPSVVESKIKVDTGASVIRLGHPLREQAGVTFKQTEKTMFSP